MSWKTNIAGGLAAVAAAITIVIQQGHSLTDWKTWILPACLAFLGYVAKDHNPPVK